MRKLYPILGALLIAALALTSCGGVRPQDDNSHDGDETTMQQNQEVYILVEGDREEVPAQEEPEAKAPEESERGGTNTEDDEKTCQELTTQDVKDLTEVDVQRLNVEPGAWVWRGSPETSERMRCPDGFICTIHLANGNVEVFVGDGKRREAVAFTVRHSCEYPANDAVNEPCDLLAKEQKFGAEEVPSFEVAAGNFECSD